MAGFPGVNIGVSSGNLLREVTVADTVPCLVATVATPGSIGKLQEVYSLADAESKGFTQEAEPFMHRLLQEYYTELGGKQRLYVFGTAETQTMADVLDVTSDSGLKGALRQSNGSITLVAIARKPAEGYNAGTGFLDTDVTAAVTAGKALAAAQQKAGAPVRMLIEGRVAKDTAANTYKPNEQGNGYVGVVLGGTEADGSAAVSIALARAAKYLAHVKLGSGQNGSLVASSFYIGSKRIEERLDMDTLHEAGFLTFHQRVGVAGYFFGRDNMCTDDDFRVLAHGRVIDKAQRIVQTALVPFIESSVRMKADGTIDDADASYIENVAESALLSGLSGQVSGVQVAVDRDSQLAQGSTLGVEVKVLPLGYLTWISVRLGLTASLKSE